MPRSEDAGGRACHGQWVHPGYLSPLRRATVGNYQSGKEGTAWLTLDPPDFRPPSNARDTRSLQSGRSSPPPPTHPGSLTRR
jgi:hypothetical protein